MSHAPRCGPSCGCRVSPAEGPGVNWSTTGWTQAAELRPHIVLTDIRSHATPLVETDAPARSAVARGARIVPWDPEPVCSPQARARFLGLVADAVEAVAGG